jgi:hypothetical protein
VRRPQPPNTHLRRRQLRRRVQVIVLLGGLPLIHVHYYLLDLPHVSVRELVVSAHVEDLIRCVWSAVSAVRQ